MCKAPFGIYTKEWKRIFIIRTYNSGVSVAIYIVSLPESVTICDIGLGVVSASDETRQSAHLLPALVEGVLFLEFLYLWYYPCKSLFLRTILIYMLIINIITFILTLCQFAILMYITKENAYTIMSASKTKK